MAHQVVWSEPAEADLASILGYWMQRNGSSTYSAKLAQRVIRATDNLARFPNFGRASDIVGVRVFPVGDYLVFYEVQSTMIFIHHIWDGRRDLKALEF